MNSSGDAAEQIVRMSLNGVEVAAKITGQGAERLAKLIYAILKDQKRTKGRASLAAMLNSNKPIKVFGINDNDLKKFCEEAKKYGVMYHVLKDKDKTDGKCDIMVKAEDAAKVNRIFERFKLGVNNQATIKRAIEKSKQMPEKARPEKSAEDKFIDELFKKPPQKEKTMTDNPSVAKTEKSRPSEPTSKTKESQRESRDYSGRHSIKKELDEIKAKQKKSESRSRKPQEQTKSQPKKTKSKKVKER